MTARRFLWAGLAVALCVCTGASAAAHTARERGRRSDVLSSRYIVVYRSSVPAPSRQTARLERRERFRTSYQYGRALKGFAARLSSRQLHAVKADPAVAYVARDRPVHALGTVALASGEPLPPTGIRRIGAATSTTARQASGANVAIVDTGIDLSHPDLNATTGKNCITSGAAAQDDEGHGTHVAGTVAGLNNGAGVVGVAPGTKLWAVKVLDSQGSGTVSQVICGIDWVTSTRSDGDPANDIGVVNMSLGGSGPPLGSCSSTDPEHKAICNSVAAGVTYVVAAGNSGWDFDYSPSPDVPAAYPEVLAVSAMSDSDGKAGATGGSPTCRTGESDDRYASFSNYAATTSGRNHTIAAPGVCIRSTYLGGGYATESGTSMSTPEVTGAAALCLNENGASGPCAGLSPANVIQKLRNDAMTHTSQVPSYGFFGDPTRPTSGHYFGYLVWPGAAGATSGDTVPPTVTSTSPPDGATGVSATTTVQVSFSEPMDQTATGNAFSLVRASDNSRVAGTVSWSGNAMTFRPSAALAAGTRYVATVQGAGAATPARDAAGNALQSTTTWSFTTAGTATSSRTASPNAVVLETGSLISGSASQLASDDDQYYVVGSGFSASGRLSSWYGSFASVPNALQSLRITYKGKNSQTCSQTVSAFNWRTNSWTPLDARSVGGTESQVDVAAPGASADYVSGTTGDGELRVRVSCTSYFTSFTTNGDLLKITFAA